MGTSGQSLSLDISTVNNCLYSFALETFPLHISRTDSIGQSLA